MNLVGYGLVLDAWCLDSHAERLGRLSWTVLLVIMACASFEATACGCGAWQPTLSAPLVSRAAVSNYAGLCLHAKAIGTKGRNDTALCPDTDFLFVELAYALSILSFLSLEVSCRRLTAPYAVCRLRAARICVCVSAHGPAHDLFGNTCCSFRWDTAPHSYFVSVILRGANTAI